MPRPMCGEHHTPNFAMAGMRYHNPNLGLSHESNSPSYQCHTGLIYHFQIGERSLEQSCRRAPCPIEIEDGEGTQSLPKLSARDSPRIFSGLPSSPKSRKDSGIVVFYPRASSTAAYSAHPVVVSFPLNKPPQTR